MFVDPQVVTVNAVAQSMARISSTGTKSEYSKADETFKLIISHIDSKERVRSMSRVDQRAIVADPLTAVNDYETLSVYTVIDRPIYGFSLVQIQQLVTGYKTWLSDAVVAQLVGRES